MALGQGLFDATFWPRLPPCNPLSSTLSTPVTILVEKLPDRLEPVVAAPALPPGIASPKPESKMNFLMVVLPAPEYDNSLNVAPV